MSLSVSLSLCPFSCQLLVVKSRTVTVRSYIAPPESGSYAQRLTCPSSGIGFLCWNAQLRSWRGFGRCLTLETICTVKVRPPARPVAEAQLAPRSGGLRPSDWFSWKDWLSWAGSLSVPLPPSLSPPDFPAPQTNAPYQGRKTVLVFNSQKSLFISAFCSWWYIKWVHFMMVYKGWRTFKGKKYISTAITSTFLSLKKCYRENSFHIHNCDCSVCVFLRV